MQVLSRKAGAALAGLAAAAALAVPMAGQASAATSTVQLHTDTSISRFLTDVPSTITVMNPRSFTDPRQQWRRTDTTAGFATFTSVQSLNEGRPRCLTGHGLQGFPVVTSERCDGTTRQEWKLGFQGDLVLRLNGLVAAHNFKSGNGTGVVMQFFSVQPNQRWHTHTV
jgi:hypothetical protein